MMNLPELYQVNQINMSNPFTGTKKFGDGNGWEYVVTIDGYDITLKLYPTANNEFHKDRSKPHKTIIGFIKDGAIVSMESQFKFENGSLYELNNEDSWNEYPEIKTSTVCINNVNKNIVEGFTITCNKCGSKDPGVSITSGFVTKHNRTYMSIICKECGKEEIVFDSLLLIN